MRSSIQLPHSVCLLAGQPHSCSCHTIRSIVKLMWQPCTRPCIVPASSRTHHHSHVSYAAAQVEYDDDQEQDSSALTIAAERRRLQLNTSAVFTTAGPQTSRIGPQAASSSSGPRMGASGRSRGRVTAAAAAAGLFNTASGGAGVGGGSVFAPAGEARTGL
jgi:hypothetical protein